MRGANGSVAGASGYAPTPAAGDQDKCLFGDAQYRTVSGTGTAATKAEADAGTDTTKYVAPDALAYALAAKVSTRATAGALAFDGTPSTRVYSPLTNQNIGTDGFSVMAKFRVPTTIAAGQVGVWGLGTSATDNVAVVATVRARLMATTGHLEFVLTTTGGSEARYRIDNFQTLFGGKVVQVVFVRPASGAWVAYVNGVAQTLTTVDASASQQSSITSTYFTLGYNNASDVITASIYSASLYNLALTQADITEIYELGGAVPERFKFGNQVAITAGSFVSGKFYRIVSVGSTDYTLIGASANTVGITFTATGVGSGTGTAVRAGAFCYYDGDLDGIGYQLHDQSTNKLHALLTTTGVSWSKPEPMGYVKALSDGTTTAQALGGGTILPANCQIVRIRARSISGTPSITLGSSSGGSQFVASVALSTTWKDLTIALTGGINTAAASLWMTASAANVVEVQLAYEQLPA